MHGFCPRQPIAQGVQHGAHDVAGVPSVGAQLVHDLVGVKDQRSPERFEDVRVRLEGEPEELLDLPVDLVFRFVD